MRRCFKSQIVICPSIMAAPDFIRVAPDGRGFTLKGSPFYFCGANTYYCMASAACTLRIVFHPSVSWPEPTCGGCQEATKCPCATGASGDLATIRLSFGRRTAATSVSCWIRGVLSSLAAHVLTLVPQTRAAEPSLRHEVTEMLDAMVATGLTVLRTWAFNDGESQWNALQPRPGAGSDTYIQRTVIRRQHSSAEAEQGAESVAD